MDRIKFISLGSFEFFPTSSIFIPGRRIFLWKNSIESDIEWHENIDVRISKQNIVDGALRTTMHGRRGSNCDTGHASIIDKIVRPISLVLVYVVRRLIDFYSLKRHPQLQ